MRIPGATHCHLEETRRRRRDEGDIWGEENNECELSAIWQNLECLESKRLELPTHQIPCEDLGQSLVP